MENTMAWAYLVTAGLLEIVWAAAMKRSEGFTRTVPAAVTLVGMLGSFGLLGLAMKTLPLGTAYTVWTGIGAAGAFVIGVVFLGEQVNSSRVTAATLIVVGVMLMKVGEG
jgi:quaternary ammonium compound-resistance protein SugE